MYKTRTVTALTISSAISLLILSTHVLAYEAGDKIIRIGATTVDPQESSRSLSLNDNPLMLGGGVTKLGLNSDTQIGLNGLYMLTKRFGIELLAATPFQHTAVATKTLADILGNVANVKQLPPTLSVIYYINSETTYKPYIGAGINYTTFFEEDLTTNANTTLSGLGLTGGDIELKDSWGLSLQVGVDYEITRHWHLNTSIRWIDIDTKAEIEFDNNSNISADISVDPYVYTLAIGYTF